MISRTAEYCLRVCVCLAGAQGEPQTTQAIALATKVPSGYLCKVLQALGRAGIVAAQRGLNGGFVLQEDPATLSLQRVIRVVDGSQRVTSCPLGIHGTNLCSLHRQLDEAAASVERVLASRTIGQLMSEPGVMPLSGAAPAGCACKAGALDD